MNALGDVLNPKTGKIIAGARSDDGKTFIDTQAKIRGGYGVLEPAQPITNTAIGVVATNAAFDKTQFTKIAQIAHDGLARTINPIHTLYDCDTLFAASTAKLTAKAINGFRMWRDRKSRFKCFQLRMITVSFCRLPHVEIVSVERGASAVGSGL